MRPKWFQLLTSLICMSFQLADTGTDVVLGVYRFFWLFTCEKQIVFIGKCVHLKEFILSLVFAFSSVQFEQNSLG